MHIGQWSELVKDLMILKFDIKCADPLVANIRSIIDFDGLNVGWSLFAIISSLFSMMFDRLMPILLFFFWDPERIMSVEVAEDYCIVVVYYKIIDKVQIRFAFWL